MRYGHAVAFSLPNLSAEGIVFRNQLFLELVSLRDAPSWSPLQSLVNRLTFT